MILVVGQTNQGEILCEYQCSCNVPKKPMDYGRDLNSAWLMARIVNMQPASIYTYEDGKGTFGNSKQLSGFSGVSRSGRSKNAR